MKCSKCGRDAILFQNYSGMHLCKTHFIADFEARAKKSNRKPLQNSDTCPEFRDDRV